MKIKTSELEDELLDEAVAKCLGLKVWKSRGGWIVLSFDDHPEFCNEYDDSDSQVFCPTYNWSQGGLIIEREKMQVSYNFDEHIWEAGWDCHVKGWGDTPLIAAMRAYVASKLGDEIQFLKNESEVTP